MSDWQSLAEDLCRIFLGWKLREDYAALLAIGEGALRIDLRSGESWCDDLHVVTPGIRQGVGKPVAGRTFHDLFFGRHGEQRRLTTTLRDFTQIPTDGHLDSLGIGALGVD